MTTTEIEMDAPVATSGGRRIKLPNLDPSSPALTWIGLALAAVGFAVIAFSWGKVAALLDEPSSGVAQRETEALGDLLQDLKRELSLTLVVIEHDIPLIMSLADRIVVMDAGSVIATGPPEIVRTDPRVVEAYLGGSIEAIERSGATPARVKEPEPV